MTHEDNASVPFVSVSPPAEPSTPKLWGFSASFPRQPRCNVDTVNGTHSVLLPYFLVYLSCGPAACSAGPQDKYTSSSSLAVFLRQFQSDPNRLL